MIAHDDRFRRPCRAASPLRWFAPLACALILGGVTTLAEDIAIPSFDTAGSVTQCADWPDEYADAPSAYAELPLEGPAEPIPATSSSTLTPEELQAFAEMEEEGEVVRIDPNTPLDGDGEVYVPYFAADRVLGYNTTTSATTWIPGDKDKFGWVSLENFATIGFGREAGWSFGTGFHFLDGPASPEMPPRLFDFSMAYQRIEWLRPNLGWDFLFRVGVFSDFEGSADEGLRFPSHLVTYWKMTPTVTMLLGVDYLDWDTIRILPVAGWTWVPTDDFRVDMVFPRPKVAMRIRDTDTWLALGGELDGGTWAIERQRSIDDNVTYQDLRLVFSIETRHGDSVGTALEIGYVFDRKLEYSSGTPGLDPTEALMVRYAMRY